MPMSLMTASTVSNGTPRLTRIVARTRRRLRSNAASSGRRPTSTTTMSAVEPTASTYAPAPIAMPTAATAQIVAAVDDRASAEETHAGDDLRGDAPRVAVRPAVRGKTDSRDVERQLREQRRTDADENVR